MDPEPELPLPLSPSPIDSPPPPGLFQIDEEVAAVPEHAADGGGGEEAVQIAEDEAEPMPVTPVVEKRRRGRPPKARGGGRTPAARAPAARRKEKEEDAVCFICFDGGDLVVCDRRGCTKVYHPACVNRDEAYFHSRGRWNCGWHICSNCEKAAHVMCYTCTYSLCKACNKGAEFVCIRGNKGFCETCYPTVMLIESNEHSDGEEIGAGFNDKTSWDYLFKIYWLGLKAKLSLTFDELSAAKNRRKRSSVVAYNEDSSDESYHVNNDQEISSDSSSEHYEGRNSARKKVRRRSRNAANEENPVKHSRNVADEDSSVKQVDNVGTSMTDDTKWASKELLEFVAHMKDGDTSPLSQFDVQALILEYIKKNNLRDPRKKSQIICDSMLQKLFQKERVGHFEMLKLLETHFLMKEASKVITDNNQGGGLDHDSGQIEDEGYSDAAGKFSSDKRRKTRKRVEEREPQTNVDDYAAIDVYNINLMYLRRSLLEDMIDDVEKFSEKVIGSFVRIKIPATDQKQDMYRLVQIVGTHVTAEKYKIGKKTTDIILEILNLDKTEAVTIETISNQDFTEEECKRLRQSIKCGLINRLTVGQVQEKARILQTVRVDDWLASEKLRLGHLRDRASEKGRRKELRECVEKLQLLNTPEERWRRLNDFPEIHADPKMDPAYESADEEESDDKNKDNFRRSRESFSLRKGRHLPFTGKGDSVPSSNWNAARKSSNTHLEVNRSAAVDKVDSFTGVGDRTKTSELLSAQGKAWVAPNALANTTGMDAGGWNNNQYAAVIPEQSYGVALEVTPLSLSTEISVPSVTSETEKMWHYQDPSGKVQGPFSMTQLRKWNTTGFFPPQMKIWQTYDKPDDYILLTNALIGKFQKELPQLEPQHSSFPQPIQFATAMNNKGDMGEIGWRENNNPPWVDNIQNRGNWNAIQNNAIFAAPGNTELGNADRWPNQPFVWSAPKIEVANPMEGRNGSRGWEAPMDVNTWSGQAQAHSGLRPTAPFPGNNYQPPPHQGSGGRGGNAGRWNRGRGSSWNSNRSGGPQPNNQGYERRQSNWNSSGQQSSREPWKVQPAKDSKSQWGSDQFNPPTPTPQPARGGWPTVNSGGGLGLNSGSNVLKQTDNTMLNQADKTDGWGSWSPVSLSIPDKSKMAETVDASPIPERSDVLGDHQTFSQQKRSSQWDASGILEKNPMDTTNMSDSVTTGSCIAEVSGTLNQNQFLQGDCPSPTPLCERQELLEVQHDPSNKPTVESDSAQRSEASPGPKLVSESEGQVPALDQKRDLDVLDPCSAPPERWDQQQPEWSLPSPTPSTKPPTWDIGADTISGNPQSNPWVSSDGSKMPPSSPSKRGTPAESAQPSNSGWGSGEVDAQGKGWDHLTAPQNPPRATGTANSGWGGWGETPAPANTDTKNGLGAPPAQGNTNANSGWGVTAPGSTNISTGGALNASSVPCSTDASTVWGAPLHGSTKPNAGWGAPANGNAANPSWTVLTQGNPNQNSGWGNSNQNPNRGAPTPPPNGGWTTGHGNRSSWGGGRGGSNEPWNNKMPPVVGGGPSRPHQTGQGQTGICRFHESGFCRKGSRCNYRHV